ncbi:polysaccharide deacetylase family protein [Bacteroidota bacterium]
MREGFKIFLGSLGFWIPQKWLIRASGQDRIFPFYHAVSDDPMPHVAHTYPVRSLKRFRKDLEFLLRHFEPVGLEELKLIEKPGKHKKPSMFLSFDDGLSEIYDMVAPELISRGIPAGIFVNTDFIDNKELFYRYKSSLLVDRFEIIKYAPAVTELLQSRYHLASSRKRCVKEFLLSISYKNKSELEEVAKLVELDFKTFLKVKQPYLTMQQLKELRDQGFYIGSHSKDHPRFSEISPDERTTQYRESIEFLQKELEIDYGAFSFPFSDSGVPADFFRDLSSEGMPRIDASFGTGGLKNDPVSFHKQRISMESGKAPAGILIRGEYLYFLLKGLFGKNEISRS